MSDRTAKLARLRALLERRGASAITLTSAESLSWLFDGARVAVPLGGAPVFSATVDRDGILVHALANEADRLAGEELGDPAGLVVVPVPWHTPLPAPADLSEVDVAADVRALRAALLPLERSRYAALGADAAAAVTAVARDLRPGTTEREVAAALAAALVAVGADPIVLLVAGESRLRVRHPLPTTAPLGSRAMLVAGARRHGLYANLTRWISFGPAADDPALFEVEADAFAATRPGRTVAQVLGDIAAAYPRHGYPADAWLGHHQGGPTGYAGRDPRATPEADDLIVAGQAFAWNPSVPAGKVEDTVIRDEDAVQVLTLDPAWPTTTVRGLARPITLEL